MDINSYHFKVGRFHCMVLSDGNYLFPEPPQALFKNTNEDQLRHAMRAHDLDQDEWKGFISTYTGVLIDTETQRVLIDSGAGDLLPTTGRLIPNLQAEGISPDEIDVVILTHGHGDHIGGSVDDEGRPAFPNARYILAKDEWDFWFSAPATERTTPELVTIIRNRLEPLKAHLSLLTEQAEILPGIRVILAAGHTPGHLAVLVRSEDENLLYTSDALLHPLYLAQPGWHASTDIDPEQAAVSRRKLLELACSENFMVQAAHFPFPGLGYILEKGDGWEWQAVEPGLSFEKLADRLNRAEPQFETILKEYMDAASARDFERMRALSTNDCIHYMHSNVWNREAYIRFLSTSKLHWQLKLKNKTIRMDQYSARMWNEFREERYTSDEVYQVEGLLSTSFRKEEGSWKIEFTHSNLRDE